MATKTNSITGETVEPTFKITINSMLTGTVGNLQDIVKQVEYTIVAEKDNQQTSTTNTVQLPTPSLDNFTSFDDLTEEQVVGWINSLEQTSSIKNYLKEQLEKKIAESVLQVKRAPWMPPNPTV